MIVGIEVHSDPEPGCRGSALDVTVKVPPATPPEYVPAMEPRWRHSPRAPGSTTDSWTSVMAKVPVLGNERVHGGANAPTIDAATPQPPNVASSIEIDDPSSVPESAAGHDMVTSPLLYPSIPLTVAALACVAPTAGATSANPKGRHRFMTSSVQSMHGAAGAAPCESSSVRRSGYGRLSVSVPETVGLPVQRLPEPDCLASVLPVMVSVPPELLALV